MGTIAIRVDASTRIGSGHVMRCLTLANHLVKRSPDSKIVFLCKKHSGHLNNIIMQHGFKLIELSEPLINIDKKSNAKMWLGCDYQTDAEECLQSFLRNTPIDLLIIDHYSLDYCWQDLIIQNIANLHQSKNYKPKLMVIDDLANRKHNCDFLLDQTLGRNKQDYLGLVPKACQLFLGKEYMLLRDEFTQTRLMAKVKRAETHQIKNMLVSLGGTDPDNITDTIISWLIKLKQQHCQITAIIIVNEQSPFLSSLQKLAKGNSWLKITCAPKSMADLILNADIAIGTAGGSAWERCCLGLPTLTITSAANQKLVNSKLTEARAIIDLGEYKRLSFVKLKQAFESLSNDNEAYQAMVINSLACCDGLGAQNLALALSNSLDLNGSLNNSVTLVLATHADCNVIFKWQSTPKIRRYLRNPEPVTWQEHCNWLKKTLNNAKIFLFIVRFKNKSVGVLRLDEINSLHHDNKQWEISIIISPNSQGRNLALNAIANIPSSFKTHDIIAEVHKENTASHRLFNKAGFTQLSPTFYRLTATSKLGAVDNNG